MVTSGTDLDHALDALYGASPSEFTARRDALAKQLKAEGDAAAAATVKAQRKPTSIAYVLNQLARRHPDDLAALVDVGRDLARAQRKALRGETGHDLRDAIGRQRAVIADLTAKTASLMKTLGVSPTGHLDEIAGALQAALVDPAVGEQLEEGRLEKVPAPAAGFPGAMAEEPEPIAEPKPIAKPKPKPKAAARARVETAAERARAAQRARAERAEEARRAKLADRERIAEERRAAALAKAREAGEQAAERARIADEAEREADGYAAQAKKLAGQASALVAEARRLAAEQKRVAREAQAAQRAAEKAAAESARAATAARHARSEADRALKRARAAEKD